MIQESIGFKFSFSGANFAYFAKPFYGGRGLQLAFQNIVSG
jgi:hypothetical protein